MSAAAVLDSRASSVPVTKFRAPRVRADTVARPLLLARLVASVATHPVTLVCAPGGSGKTTLLSQFAAGVTAQTDAALVWIALDRDDNFPDRFFAALVEALEPLALTWDCDPRALVAGTGGEGAGRRAALAHLVNALCTTGQRRITLVLDDLHRLDCDDVYRILESLIERLPDHVAVVLCSRREPPLPTARWRAHAELGDITPTDLSFSEGDGMRLAELRTGATPDPETIRTAIAGTQGWAVGVSLLLQGGPATRGAGGLESAPRTVASRRHLFAYLAHEILAELPEDLQSFVLECSILDELRPDLCEAVTGRADSAHLLDALYRHNLFLTVVDDSVPVLRFHDLFRDFLEHELARRTGSHLRELHERAALGESCRLRSIHHLLRAEAWPAAIDAIVREGQARLAAGGIGAVENWLERIPEPMRERDPRVGLLRGACAWLRWDWTTARRSLERSLDAIGDPTEQARQIRSLIQLVDALNSSGDADAAMRRLQHAATLPLEDFGRAEVALLRAWCLARSGTENDAVVASMREFVGYAAAEPARICPATAGRVHCTLIGLPGMADCFEHFATLCDGVRGSEPSPWQLAALAVSGWAKLWRGDRAGTAAAIRDAEAIYQQFGGIRLVGERLGQLKAIYCAAIGDMPQAVTIAERHIEGLNSPEVERHRATWQRAYRHAFARMHWIAGNQADFEAQLPFLLAPTTAVEWPFVDTAADVVRGQAAIFRKDWRSAEEALVRAVAGYARHRMGTVFADPRVSLAFARLARGDRAGAWSAFAPVYEEVLGDGAYGLLILDARENVVTLLNELPELTSDARVAEVINVLDMWAPSASADSTRAAAGPLASLTDRELEVLAQVATGAGNKHIARRLALSLHTVKRHLANILDKLDCDSRGQAADLYRRHTD